MTASRMSAVRLVSTVERPLTVEMEKPGTSVACCSGGNWPAHVRSSSFAASMKVSRNFMHARRRPRCAGVGGLRNVCAVTISPAYGPFGPTRFARACTTVVLPVLADTITWSSFTASATACVAAAWYLHRFRAFHLQYWQASQGTPTIESSFAERSATSSMRAMRSFHLTISAGPIVSFCWSSSSSLGAMIWQMKFSCAGQRRFTSQAYAAIWSEKSWLTRLDL